MRIFLLLLILSLRLSAQEKPVFQAYELIIQSEQKIQLSAWQAEVFFEKDKLKLTGIEGGEKPFDEPADYDSRGLTGGKLILAAFTLEKLEQNKEIVVARIHVLGPKNSRPIIKLVVAADGKGKKIKAKALLRSVKKNE